MSRHTARWLRPCHEWVGFVNPTHSLGSCADLGLCLLGDATEGLGLEPPSARASCMYFERLSAAAGWCIPRAAPLYCLYLRTFGDFMLFT